MQATGVRQRGMAYGCGTVRVGQGRDVLSGQARVVRHVEQQRVGGWRANHAANTLACIAQEWGQIGYPRATMAVGRVVPKTRVKPIKYHMRDMMAQPANTCDRMLIVLTSLQRHHNNESARLLQYLPLPMLAEGHKAGRQRADGAGDRTLVALPQTMPSQAS